MIVIGSKALLHRLDWVPAIFERFNRSDYDVIMSLAEFSSWSKEHRQVLKSLYPTSGNKYKAIIIKDGRRKQYEIELGIEGTSSEFLLKNVDKVCDGVITGHLGESFNTLSLHYQLLTKRSHLIYPVHFEKNIADYHLLKSLVDDFERNETMEQYYKLRFNEAKERFKNFKTPKLNVTNDDFFSSKLVVERYFIHDDIHEIMKHHDVPIYEMMKRDFSLAKCEKDMFFALPHEYQVQCVQEEAYTIALERYVIPQAGEDWADHFECYKKALKRICTTLTSGWFRDFAIENYMLAVERYNHMYVENFKQAIKDGRIVPLQEVLSHLKEELELENSKIR